MIKRDYYRLLDLGRGATLNDIKKQFRRLALQYHPDRNPGDPLAEEYFKLVAEAYHVLSDHKRRHLYDQSGHEGLKEQGYQGFQRTEDVLKTFAAEFFDFLGIAGGARRQKHPSRGADLCYQMEISPREARMGVRKRIQVSTREMCGQCRGNGIVSASQLHTCPWCQGSGKYTESSGIFTATGTCHKCNGRGTVRMLLCESCNGRGRREINKDLLVDIPAGVENETRLKISREGDGGEQSSESGDLYLVLRVTS